MQSNDQALKMVGDQIPDPSAMPTQLAVSVKKGYDLPKLTKSASVRLTMWYGTVPDENDFKETQGQKGADPQWNEDFVFDLKPNTDATLEVAVYDKQIFLGQDTIQLAVFPRNKPVSFDLQLFGAKNKNARVFLVMFLSTNKNNNLGKDGYVAAPDRSQLISAAESSVTHARAAVSIPQPSSSSSNTATTSKTHAPSISKSLHSRVPAWETRGYGSSTSLSGTILDDQSGSHIEVKVLAAKGLESTQAGGRNTIVRLELGNDWKEETTPIRNVKTAIWNQTFRMPLLPNGPSTLYLEVMDSDSSVGLGAGSIDVASFSWDSRSFHMCSVLLRSGEVESGSLNLLFRTNDTKSVEDWARKMQQQFQPPLPNLQLNENASQYGSRPYSPTTTTSDIHASMLRGPSSSTGARPSREGLQGPTMQVTIRAASDLPPDEIGGERFVSLALRETGWQATTKRVSPTHTVWNESFRIPLPTRPPAGMGLDLALHSVDRNGATSLLSQAWIAVENVPDYTRNFDLQMIHPTSRATCGMLEVLARFVDTIDLASPTSVTHGADGTYSPSASPIPVPYGQQSIISDPSSSILPSRKPNDGSSWPVYQGLTVVLGFFVVTKMELAILRSPPEFLDAPSDIFAIVRTLGSKNKSQKMTNAYRLDLNVKYPDILEFEVCDLPSFAEIQFIQRDRLARDVLLGSCRMQIPESSEERTIKLNLDSTPSFPLLQCTVLVRYRTDFEDDTALQSRRKQAESLALRTPSLLPPTSRDSSGTVPIESHPVNEVSFEVPMIQRHSLPPYVTAAHNKDSIARLATNTSPLLYLIDMITSNPLYVGIGMFVILLAGYMSMFFQLLLISLIGWGVFAKISNTKPGKLTDKPKDEKLNGKEDPTKTAKQKVNELELQAKKLKAYKERQAKLQKSATKAEDLYVRGLGMVASLSENLSWRDPKVSSAVLLCMAFLLILSLVIPLWFFSLLAILAFAGYYIHIPEAELKRDAYLRQKPGLVVIVLVLAGCIIFPLWLTLIIATGYLAAFSKVPALRKYPKSDLLADSMYAINRALFGAERPFVGLLKLQVMEADVRGPGNSTVDPFVVCTAEQGQVRYTTVAIDTNNPQWRDNWPPLLVSNLAPIRLQVWDNINPIMLNANQDFLGETYLKITGPVQQSIQWLSLKTRKDDDEPAAAAQNRGVSGRILVSYSVTELQVRVPRKMASAKVEIESTKTTTQQPLNKTRLRSEGSRMGSESRFAGLSGASNPTFERQRSQFLQQQQQQQQQRAGSQYRM